MPAVVPALAMRRMHRAPAVEQGLLKRVGLRLELGRNRLLVDNLRSGLIGQCEQLELGGHTVGDDRQKVLVALCE